MKSPSLESPRVSSASVVLMIFSLLVIYKVAEGHSKPLGPSSVVTFHPETDSTALMKPYRVLRRRSAQELDSDSTNPARHLGHVHTRAGRCFWLFWQNNGQDQLGYDYVDPYLEQGQFVESQFQIDPKSTIEIPTIRQPEN